jgi:hypothetical protein
VTLNLGKSLTLGISLLLLLSACSAESASDSEQAISTTQSSSVDESQDNKGEFISIQSDNVSLAGYDASTQRMTVVFDNGKAYWYQPVDQSVWTAFYNAQPHPWSQVGYPALVESGIPYGKLN